MATKLFPADTSFSNIVRERDGWACQYPGCTNRYTPPTQALHNSHFYSRGKWNTRYDMENCLSVCYGHHRYWDKHIEEYKAYKISQLGQQAFDLLTLRANSKSPLGSTFWKKLTKKQADLIFSKLC